MPTRLAEIVIDTPDAVALARWWAAALEWEVTDEDPEETSVVPPRGAPGLELVFGRSADVKAGKNRVHLDLAPGADVARLEALGARRIDIGQGDVPWSVLADPDGNEFCVLEPRPGAYGPDTGAIQAIVCDALDPLALGTFWTVAAGWAMDGASSDAAGVRLRAPSGTGPWLEFVRTSQPHTYKNRWHLEVAGWAADDQAAEVAHLLARGATHADVGQTPEATWVVLKDPEENEFCLLSPRN